MTLDDAAAWAGVFSGVIVPFAALAAWGFRRLRLYIRDEIAKGREQINSQVVPKLTNGEKSGASYAREARDLANKAVELSIVTDARCKRLEEKMDLFILAWDRKVGK